MSRNAFTRWTRFHFGSEIFDKEAEEFIVSWARELPCDRPLRIGVVHLPEAQAALPEAREIGAAITSYFRRPS